MGNPSVFHETERQFQATEIEVAWKNFAGQHLRKHVSLLLTEEVTLAITGKDNCPAFEPKRGDAPRELDSSPPYKTRQVLNCKPAL